MPEDSGSRYKSPVCEMGLLVWKARKFEFPGSNTFRDIAEKKTIGEGDGEAK